MRRFELLKGVIPYLVSSEAHSTGLCDISSPYIVIIIVLLAEICFLVYYVN